MYFIKKRFIPKAVIVDADYSFRGFLSKMVKDAGWEPVEFDNGSDAFSYLNQQQDEIKFVISEILLPGIDGLELARLFSTCRNTRLAFILITNSACAELREIARKIGVSSYMFKQDCSDLMMKQTIENVTKEDHFLSCRL